MQTNQQAKSSHLLALSQSINFEQLIEAGTEHYDEGKVAKMKERRRVILAQLGREPLG
jgi:hypothetical protein